MTKARDHLADSDRGPPGILLISTPFSRDIRERIAREMAEAFRAGEASSR